MIAVVVLTKNSEKTIERCLRSLLESSYPPKELIIVDGGSKDYTLVIVEKFSKLIKTKVVYDGGKGLGYARDIGWRTASSQMKYIAMVDSDVVLDKTFFEDAISILEKDEKLGGLGAKLVPETGEEGLLSTFQVKNLAIHLHWAEKPYPNEVASTHTACTIFRRSALEEIRGFDSYFTLAKEDSDVSFRLRKAGYHLSYLQHFLPHLETGTRFNKINFRYGRSYVLIARKHPIDGKLWTRRNIFFTIALIIFPLELFVGAHYLLRYIQLKDLGVKDAIVMSFLETVRQILRTAGMLYELLLSPPK